MVDWEPRENMGRLAYQKFKRGMWVKVESLPEWVNNAKQGPREGGRSEVTRYKETFTGDSLEYKIEYEEERNYVTDVKQYARVKD